MRSESVFDRRIVVGLALGTASAVLGGAWQVATRLATTTTIVPADLALLRYGIPAAVLLPLVLRVGLLPRHVARRHLALMVLGAGLPFGLVAMSGTRFAPSAHMGVLMAGASPLFAAALAWLLWRERPDRSRRAGFVLMLLGVALLGSKSSTAAEAQAWIGDALFLLAAGMWAGFTLSFRRAGLTPWQGAALVNVWSALLLLPWLVWRGALGLIDAPAHDILLQALWQGCAGTGRVRARWVVGARRSPRRARDLRGAGGGCGRGAGKRRAVVRDQSTTVTLSGNGSLRRCANCASATPTRVSAAPPSLISV
jgi:drug/metabolite transporter (DMT)-like permease